MAVMDQKQIQRQEQILKNEMQKLERLDKIREQMVKQIQKEAELLEKLSKENQEVLTEMTSSEPIPPTTGTIPISFKSQYDQFNTTPEMSYPSSMGGGALGDTIETMAEDFEVNLKPMSLNESMYNARDNSEHWSTLVEDPGIPVYVSGQYVSTRSGTPIYNSKNYEYELSVNALPVTVGDILTAPVHPTGHNDGKAFTTNFLRMRINDIYTNNTFTAYHDRIE